MKKIIARHHRKGIAYYHQEKQMYFGRIVAGLALPGKLPGFAAVFGEEEVRDHVLKVSHIHLLAEIDTADAGELLASMADLIEVYEIGDVIGHLDDPTLYYLIEFNSSQKKKNRPTVHVSSPPYAEQQGDEITFYIRVLIDRLKPAEKSLHLGQGSKLAAFMAQLPASEVAQARARDYPAIAAASFVVSALTLWPKIDPDRLPDNYLDSDYYSDFGL